MKDLALHPDRITLADLGNRGILTVFYANGNRYERITLTEIQTKCLTCCQREKDKSEKAA